MPDRIRARSFGPAAAAYAAHRPDYPATAIDWALAPAPGPRVLDLAAGTGKLTAGLLGRGLEVVAVEPDPGMLAQLRADLPEVDAREGSAEAIPLPDGSVDALLVGQAIHWFDLDRAWPEMARVLSPGGVLAGLWNCDDAEVDWVRGLHESLAHGRSVPQGGDSAALEPPAPFGPVERATFPFLVPTTTDGLIATLGTHSWALTSTDDERDAAFGRLRRYLAGRPETASGEFALPLFTLTLRTVRS